MKIEIDSDEISYVLVGVVFILLILAVSFSVRTNYIDKVERELFQATNTISIKK